MLDHMAIQRIDPPASGAFRDAVLTPLGIIRMMDFDPVVGFGTAGRPDVWIGSNQTSGAFVRDPDGNDVESVCHATG
jgi:hypothetical protein